MQHLGLLISFVWHDSAVVDLPKYGQCNDSERATEFINRHEP